MARVRLKDLPPYPTSGDPEEGASWFRKARAKGWVPCGRKIDLDHPDTAASMREIEAELSNPAGARRLRVHRGWASLPLGDTGWKVSVSIERRDARIVVTGYQIVPYDPEACEPLRLVAVGKRLGLGTICEQVIEEIEWNGLLSPDWADLAVELPRTGQRTRPDVFYALWAERYVEALAARPAGPIRWLAEQWPDETHSGLLAKINRARARDLLTRAPKGKAGGELTGKARQLLTAKEG